MNKVASAVKLRFDVRHSPSLPNEVRSRLIKLAGKRVNQDGVLVIAVQRYRSQEQNRQDALERLVDLVRRAAIPPKRRVKTRPTKASQEKRLESKRRRGIVKRLRQGGSEGP